jgi:hypothetical protein
MRQLAFGILLTTLVAASASAQTPAGSSSTGLLEGVTFSSRALASAAAAAQAAPAAKKYTLLFGADTPAVYLFRGIRQEGSPDLTVQPYLDLGFAASDKVNVNIGTWNSFHTGSLSFPEDEGGLGNPYYEFDFYASMTFLAGKWKPGVLYTLYTSPSGGYDSVGEDGSIGVNELAVFASYDDSAMTVPMSPKFTVAFELTDTQADFGAKKGIYIEAAAKPAFKIAGTDASLYIPIKLGLSGKDYYEFGGEDSTFGFFDIGLGFGVPLGIGEVHGGLDIYTFGESLKNYNGKRTNSVASVGFSITK